jgi:hypothetical protein
LSRAYPSLAIAAANWRMSPMTSTAPRACRRAACSGPQWLPPQKPIGVIAADRVASMPTGLSSMMRQRSGAVASRRAAKRNRSGDGLPRATIVALKRFSPKYFKRPVNSSLRRICPGALSTLHKPAVAANRAPRQLRQQPRAIGGIRYRSSLRHARHK